MDNDKAAWAERLVQAKVLTDKGMECAMCGGTGGWPGVSGFVTCMPCSGMGASVPPSTTPQ